MLNKLHRRRITSIMISTCVVITALGLVLYALRQNINAYYTPNELTEEILSSGRFIKLGGMVETDSLRRQDELAVSFRMTDFQKTIEVKYQGILPDLFAEGQGAIAEGRFEQGVFIAKTILAKHDENYMPPEIARKMKLT